MTEDPDNLEHQRRLGRAYHNLAETLFDYDDAVRQAEADEIMQRAIDIRSNIASAAPENDDDLLAGADSYSSMARRCRERDRIAEAASFQQQASPIYRRLLAKAPENTTFQSAMSDDLVTRGTAAAAADNYQEALDLFEQARALLQPLFQRSPGKYRARLATCLYHVAMMNRMTSQHQRALDIYAEALPLMKHVAEENDQVTAHREQLADIHIGIAAIYLEKKSHYDRADEHLELASRYLRRLAKESPNQIDVLEKLALNTKNVSLVKMYLERPDESNAAINEAIERFQALVDKFPSQQRRLNLLSSLSGLGNRLSDAGELAEALKTRQRALAEAQQLVEDNPEIPRFGLALGACYCNCGSSYLRLEDYALAIRHFDHGVEVLEGLSGQLENVFALDQFRRNTYFGLAKAHEMSTEYYEALADLDRALSFKNVPFDGDLKISKARILARQGQLNEAAELVEAVIAENPPGDHPIANYAAPVFAVAAKVAKDSGTASEATVNQYIGRSLELLQIAGKDGYLKFEQRRRVLETDSDFDILRDHPISKRCWQAPKSWVRRTSRSVASRQRGAGFQPALFRSAFILAD